MTGSLLDHYEPKSFIPIWFVFYLCWHGKLLWKDSVKMSRAPLEHKSVHKHTHSYIRFGFWVIQRFGKNTVRSLSGHEFPFKWPFWNSTEFCRCPFDSMTWLTTPKPKIQTSRNDLRNQRKIVCHNFHMAIWHLKTFFQCKQISYKLLFIFNV